MKVLAINGSTRKDGNTAILINTVFEELTRQELKRRWCSFLEKSLNPARLA